MIRLTGLLEDPGYRAAMAKLDEGVREWHAACQRYGNEVAPGLDPGEVPERAFVTGWVLSAGLTGLSAEGEEFDSSLVEVSPGLSRLAARGLVEEARDHFRLH